MKSDPSTKATGAGRGLEIILGALVAAALANLCVLLFLGGYDARFHGMAVRAHRIGTPLLILLGLVTARWLANVRRGGLRASLGSLLPWGLVGAAAGLAVFLFVALRQPLAIPGRAIAMVAALAVSGYILSWLAYGPPLPGHARAIVVILFLALAAGLADSLARRDLWGQAFGLPRLRGPVGVTVSADRVGLLASGGSDAGYEKAAAGYDWRNAAVVKPGGFFSSEVDLKTGDTIRFSVAVRGPASGVKAAVTAVQASMHKELWATDASSLEPGTWTEVNVNAPFEGKAQLVFDASGGEGAAAMLFANPRVEAATPGAARPNLLVILVDALRADRLSLYGCNRQTSPEIDSLAARATVFDNCIAQASWTMPSVATLFTSVYPSAHGVLSTETALSPSLETMAEALQKAGYRTCGVQTNSLVVPEYGFCKGFDEYYAFPFVQETTFNKKLYHVAAEVNAKALDRLKSQSERPFFLYLHYMDVHDPYEPPEEFRVFGASRSDLYDGEILYFSREFGRFFGELDKAGILKNTIVVLAADHGEQFLEHGGIKHGVSLYSEETHVPLVVWMPGQSEGRRVAARVGLIDVPVTLLAAAGVPAPRSAAGRSLLPALRTGALDEAEAFSELTTIYTPGRHLVSLTKGDYRLIVLNPTLGRQSMCLELYDLAGDAAERVNLAGSKSEVLEAMLAEIKDYVAAQTTLHRKLVPEPVKVKLDKARRDQLQAIGYLMPQTGGDADK